MKRIECGSHCVQMLTVCALSVFAGVAEGAVPFSFEYGGKPSAELLPGWRHEIRAEGETWRSPDGFEVTMKRDDRPAFDAEEWTMSFANRGTADSAILTAVRDADLTVRLPPEPKKFPGDISVPGDRAVIVMQGCVPGETYSYDDKLAEGEFSFRPHYFRRGQLSLANGSQRSSDVTMPFFDLTGMGEGVIAAIGWSGGWKADFSNEPGGIRLRTGLARARFRLHPGECVRTTSVLLMRYAKNEDKSNKFRRLLRARYACPQLVACELWGGLPSAEMCHRIERLDKEGIRFDQYWIDAGWYGRCRDCRDSYTGDWFDHVGDWSVNPRVHPRGLVDVRDAAKAVGSKLLLWFEPERCAEASPVYRVDAPWVIHPSARRYAAIDFGQEGGWNYAWTAVTGLVERLDLGCYRQDFNVSLGAWRSEDGPDREGLREIRHVTALYGFWDALHARYPRLLIDNCASGGRRIDVETLKRSIPFFRSDYQCGFNVSAEVLQAQNANLSFYVPQNGCTTKAGDLYTLRSSWSASWGASTWSTVFQEEDKVDFTTLRTALAQYRRVRDYLTADFYNHGSATADPSSWAIWQYHDPGKKAGCVIAFRRGGSPFDRVTVALKGRLGTARIENLDTGTVDTIEDGHFEIVLPNPRSSGVFVYRTLK